MSTLHLLKYNNYYNRIVRREPDLSGYQAYQVKYNGAATDPNGNTAILQNVNFVDGDFVDTAHVVNWQGDIPDYVLVVENNIIKSRWFVIDTEKTRGGQLRLLLHRDLVVDYLDNLMAADTKVFVEKATVPFNNDLIFNSEAMTFNQIKTSEVLLKDASKSPWICIYAASKQADGSATLFDISGLQTLPLAREFESITEFNNWSLKKAADTRQYFLESASLLNLTMRGYYIESASNAASKKYVLSKTEYSESGSSDSVDISLRLKSPFSAREVYKQYIKTWDIIEEKSAGYNLPSDINNDQSAIDELNQFTNQFVSVKQNDGSLRYYKIKKNLQWQIPTTITPRLSDSSGALWVDGLKPPTDALCIDNYSHVSGIDLLISRVLSNISIDDVTDSVDAYRCTIGAGRYHLTDAPYDMFCMPYVEGMRIKNSRAGSFTEITTSKSLALAIARGLIEKYAGAGQVYDAQILPYCPLTSTIISETDGVVTMDLNDPTTNGYSEIINASNTVVGYVFHASVSSFSRTIALENPIVIQDYKIENECDMYRLCSPNYSSAFEFSAAKNGGVNEINVQCTYKPYTPYIKLYPTWGRLYGSNFGADGFDARGLICGGDFSLPMTTSAWTTYELQNKNYQRSFDRQIQNLEVQYDVERERKRWQVAAGTSQGVASGAIAGLALGNPIGAALGAIIGGGFSLAGGIRDIQLNEKLRREVLDYTRDQFGYQLGNIKALPQGLSRVTAYNIDNKYFPFLEYYTCSEVEKQALRDKIKYNGMTVMTIGSMLEYVSVTDGAEPHYFKGKLIRLSNFIGDYHILNALANEIYQGVFI